MPKKGLKGNLLTGIIAVGLICAIISMFFEEIKFLMPISFCCLAIHFVFNGLNQIKLKKKIEGIFYILISIFLLFVSVLELLS